MRSARHARGFTLLEILIGMMILGLGVVSALQVFGSSVQLARAASRRSEAVVHAKALMDSVLWVPDLKAGESHGVIGNGFRWARSIRAAGPDDGMPDEGARPSELKLAVISVLVEWDEPTGVKNYRIGTMRIVPNNG
ncbi:MAG TPA: prepilin-type N-terminal cleavage/methylation domain-containing protein [Candidatus Binatia bacterium]|nr:prepilin-type N-terminal cleavage/methylation domain-containing protein [Candidatus Binatia bacterium]